MTAGPDTVSSHLVLLDRDGTRTDLPDSGGMTWFPRFSPKGDRIAYGLSAGSDVGGGSADLWTLNLARGARTPVTFSGNNRFYPIWTPDGSRLTFADGSTGTNRIHTASVDGSGSETFLTEGDRLRYPTSWLRDGSALAIYVSAPTAPSRDLGILRREEQKWIKSPFVVTPFEEMGGVFSPSGRWLAYVSNKSGVNDIYARPYPGPGDEVTISVGGGGEPVWQPSGGRLFYRRNGKLLAVSIDETPTSLNMGPPEPVLDDPYQTDMSATAGGAANYDISPDGKRFVMVEVPKAGPSSRTRRIQVIVNWFDELKRRVPVNSIWRNRWTQVEAISVALPTVTGRSSRGARSHRRARPSG